MTLVPLMPETTVKVSSAGLVVMTGNLSARMPTTMSTKSPVLMTVPTPVTWSTWTVMARLPVGTSMSRIVPAPVAPNVSAVSCAPVRTCWRTVWPMTWVTSPNAVGVCALQPAAAVSVTMSAVTCDTERDVDGRDDGGRVQLAALALLAAAGLRAPR